ncbi:hypothetical protein POJ06DRAFT_56144 [Lipomyces tetrasporus]|uniref:Zn(2)-C6 fungal-type domain-containing protein n=1 Tax=Lipomyces tetrasporus TaxID=54092 RepID=A0AAD7VVB7_9ASCO|nr:uncharacterized protein POJ06DRAFT_56144 [Lipomyces tetrasporus]KAJ8102804.1 hypothetical protein POJ06DRAFT_56144 [Lipomyces tetrasporus]
MQSYELHFSTFPAASAVPHCTHLTEVSTRKRVGKACDACRIKKTKCDGSKPCSRCIAEDKICVFTDRKRSTDKLYAGSYVELLESRIKMLQQGIELLVQRINRGDSITSLLDDQGKISINKVLETLSVKCAETDAMSGSKRASSSRAIATSAAMIDEDDIENTESTADYSTKRRRESEGELATHSEPQSSPLEAEEYSLDNVSASLFDPPYTYPISLSQSYAALSDLPSLVSSPAIEPSFCTSPSPELTHLTSLTFSLAPYSLDSLFLREKTSGTSSDVWPTSRAFEI